MNFFYVIKFYIEENENQENLVFLFLFLEVVYDELKDKEYKFGILLFFWSVCVGIFFKQWGKYIWKDCRYVYVIILLILV